MLLPELDYGSKKCNFASILSWLILKPKYYVNISGIMSLMWTIRICVCLNFKMTLEGKSTIIQSFSVKANFATF